LATHGIIGIFIAIVSGILLLIGFVNGQMPTTMHSVEPNRSKNPILFWTIATIYILVCFIGAWSFLKEIGNL
jgi:hypothetical protein